MAIKRIEKDDLIAKKPLDNLTQGAKEAEASVKMLETAMKAVVELAKQVKEGLKNLPELPRQPKAPSSKVLKTTKELNDLTAKATQLEKNRLGIDKELQKEKVRLQGLNRERNKLLKEEIALEGRQLGLEERLLKSNKELRLARKQLVETDKDYEKELKRINDQLNKNNEQLAKTRDNDEKRIKSIGRYEKAVSSLRSGLGRLAGAFGLAFGAQAVVGFVKDLNEIANQSQGVTFAFERLGTQGVDAFERVKKSTRGLLSNLDIKRSLVEFDNFNISLEESDTLFEFLAVRATQTGQSIDKLKDSLVEGLSKESKLRIDNLGISAKQLNDQLEITPNFVEAVAIIAKREIAEAGDILDSAASGQAKWNAEIANTKERLANELKPTLDSVLETGARGLRFFVDNFSEILSIVKSVTKAFIIYRGVLFSLKMAERVREFIDFGKAVKSGDKSLKDATSNVQKFGRAITAIGWTALISFVTNLALSFKDVATGATEARIATEKFNDESERTNKLVGKEIADRQKQLDNFKGTNEERAILIESLKAENKQQQANLKQNIEARLEWQKTTKAYLDSRRFLLDAALTVRESGFSATLTKEQEDLLSLSDAYAESRAKVLSYSEAISTLKAETFETSNATNDLGDGVSDLGDRVSSSTKDISDYTLEIDKATESTYSFAKAARALEDAKPKRFEDLDRPDEGIVDVDIEEFEEVEEQKLFIQQEYIDLATDYFIKRADERIAKIQEETDAATKQADYYKQLAIEGNITAKESLAEQNQIIAEANAKKEQEEQRKQRILLISSVLQAFNSNLEQGDSSGEALTKAITSTSLITQFISALPAFEDGTENTSIDGRGKNIDGKGGFHAVLHQNERVLTSDQNDMIGDYSNNEVAAIMQKHRLGQLTSDTQIMVGFGSEVLVNQLMNVENKLDDVTKAIQDKPVPNIEMGEITQSYMTLNKRIQTRKGVTTSKFKVN